MCVGIPMVVERCEDGMAECAGRGRRERLNTMLLGDVPCGSWVLAYQGSAVRTLSEAKSCENEIKKHEKFSARQLRSCSPSRHPRTAQTLR